MPCNVALNAWAHGAPRNTSAGALPCSLATSLRCAIPAAPIAGHAGRVLTSRIARQRIRHFS
eukprot:215494-Pyramimonas_sp.AAC.1